ncbi:MAG TPA: zinc-binding dehydrogenase [Spirochaetia bacterium]|nr:zinc-binding dehydrogenase [Spirochaetia bacterium]
MKSVQLLRIGEPLADRDASIANPGVLDALVRVEAAGVCRSDLHYRSGTSYAGPLPLIPGHEVAGRLEHCGSDARELLAERGIDIGSRVSVHYLVSCGHCRYCMAGHEQFCTHGAMVGKHRAGGFAEYLQVPARNLVAVPDAVSTEAAAIMMCSTATALHALHKAGLNPGDRVAVFGVGGLGMSAVQLARAMGALEVYAVDIDQSRLAQAASYGAITINARDVDAAEAIREHTGGGAECVVELLGLAESIDGAIRSVGPLGRVAIAGIAEHPVPVDTYRDLVGREATIVGVSDHSRAEIEYALSLAAKGSLRFDDVITKKLPLEAAAINGVLDSLAGFGPGVRSVVVPT